MVSNDNPQTKKIQSHPKKESLDLLQSSLLQIANVCSNKCDIEDLGFLLPIESINAYIYIYI
jgi:hypothetical protein